jgi:hypothetical protein
LLRHFASLALSWQAGLLTTEDVRPIQYYVLRVIHNPEVRKYVAFIEQWTARANLAEHPYSVLAKLCKALSNDA